MFIRRRDLSEAIWVRRALPGARASIIRQTKSYDACIAGGGDVAWNGVHSGIGSAPMVPGVMPLRVLSALDASCAPAITSDGQSRWARSSAANWIASTVRLGRCTTAVVRIGSTNADICCFAISILIPTWRWATAARGGGRRTSPCCTKKPVNTSV